MNTRLRRALVIGVCALFATAGAVYLWLRHRPSTVTIDDGPACIGDKRCARDRALALQRSVRSASAVADANDMNIHALALDTKALVAAFDRDDCDAATELASGIERYPLNRTLQPNLTRAIDDALHARLGYCALAIRTSFDPPPPGSVIRLDRLGCGGGSCPVYGVTVDDAGHVVWEGKLFVVREGHAERTIPVARARELFDAFERLSFTKGPTGFEPHTEDAPRSELSLVRGAVRHVFHDDDEGDSVSIDSGMNYLERRVDAIAGTTEWIEGSDARTR